MPRVLNLHHTKGVVPPGAIRVDRRTKFGNRFIKGKHGDRKTVIRLHCASLPETGLLEQVDELRGADLCCWCDPLPCHAHTYLRIANRPEGADLYETWAEIMVELERG